MIICKNARLTVFKWKTRDKLGSNISKEKISKSGNLFSLIETILFRGCAREFISRIYCFMARQSVREITVDIKQLISNRFRAFERATTTSSPLIANDNDLLLLGPNGHGWRSIRVPRMCRRKKKRGKRIAPNNRLVDHRFAFARPGTLMTRRTRFACHGTISLDPPRPALSPPLLPTRIFPDDAMHAREGIVVAENRKAAFGSHSRRDSPASESRRRSLARSLALGFSHLHIHARLDLTCDWLFPGSRRPRL